ncbi:recombinase family protein, partial [Gordonibacter sp.]|uniref:recombinase family protein n=1 Tax=Gordonibacter sp. TaxID=1968902 RepID=UPI002FC79B7B
MLIKVLGGRKMQQSERSETVEPKTRAVIYARYSSHSQREESIEDQVRACEEAAARAGDEVLAVFFDRAVSGTTDRRDGFQGLISLSKNKEWQRAWTYKTDRFARDRYDAAIYKRELKKCGVEVRYAAEPIPDGPTGVLMESLLEGMAEYYSANLAENVRRGLAGNAAKCHPNGQIRYGWDIVGAYIDAPGKYHPGDHYEINARESEAVRVMYSMRARGYAWTSIAAHLDSFGYTNKY